MSQVAESVGPAFFGIQKRLAKQNGYTDALVTNDLKASDGRCGDRVEYEIAKCSATFSNRLSTTEAARSMVITLMKHRLRKVKSKSVVSRFFESSARRNDF